MGADSLLIDRGRPPPGTMRVSMMSAVWGEGSGGGGGLVVAEEARKMSSIEALLEVLRW